MVLWVKLTSSRTVSYTHLAKHRLSSAANLPATNALTPSKHSCPIFPSSGENRDVYKRQNVDTASLIGAAELTGLSASYVSTIFHRCLNQTFSDFLNQTRMEKAMQLLKEGRSVSDTAWMVGYNNPRNFSRVFKQYHGVDPCPAKR